MAVAALSLVLGACTAGGVTGQAAQATPVAAASAAPVPAGLESFYNQEVSWAPCEDDDTFHCATVKVPLDYDNPAGQSIDLALKKLPSTSGHPIGSLLVNPGGPGGSGIELVSQGPAAFSEKLRAGFDIIGFDPRGVGASTPLTCLSKQEMDEIIQESTGQDSQGTQAGATQEDEGVSEEITAESAIEEGRTTASSCEMNSSVPEIIDHMDTDSVARDLDVLRALADDERLYYLGTSYGTFLGTRYAELFPANVGRMVLDSAVDPSLGMSELGLGQATAMEASLRTYVETCQAGSSCPLDGDVDAGMARLRELIDSANDSPLPTDEPGVAVDGATIQATLIDLMYDDYAWGDLTAALTEAIDEGKATQLAALAEPPSTETDPQAAAEAQAQAAANEPAINAVDCLDYPVEGDRAQWDEQAEEIKRSAPTVGDGLGYNQAFCQGWGRQSERQPAAARAAGAAPILVVGVTGDPATPYQWAQALASQLESGHLLTVEGNGHGAYMRTGECVDTAVDAYLLRGELPKEGLTCTADTNAAS